MLIFFFFLKKMISTFIEHGETRKWIFSMIHHEILFPCTITIVTLCERRKRIFLIYRLAKEKLGWRSGTNKIGKGWRNPRIRFPCLSCECSCHSLDQRVSRPEPSLSPDLFRINPFTLIVRNQCNQVPRSWFIGKVNDNFFQISNPLRLLSKCTFHFHSVDHARVRRGIGRNIMYVREIFIFFANLIILYSFFFSSDLFTPHF